jgi:hypothetical protein
MLDQDFCTFLEYKITAAFENSKDEDLKGFWCDGITLPALEIYYSQKFVNDNRKIILTALIGKTGQDEYELTLNFGQQSLSKYARELDISECVPDPQNGKFFDVDTIKRTMTIQLD